MSTSPMPVTFDEETRIDIAAKALLGTEARGAVEALLDANPGLAGEGFFIRAGRPINVPVFVVAGPANLPINPWD